MKPIFLIALALLSLAYTNAARNFLSDEFINEINSMQSLWTAQKPSKNITVDSIRGMVGVIKKPRDRSYKIVHHEGAGDDIPDKFDSRKQWPDCTSISEITDQSDCASCWAVSTASAMSDRICISSNAKKQTRISANFLMSCCALCGDGCGGGEPSYAWDYWRTDGITTGGLYQSAVGCQTYPFPTCEHYGSKGTHSDCKDKTYDTPACVRTCDDDKNKFELTYGKDSYLVKGETDIQREIMTNGPVVAVLRMYEDLCAYTKGIYRYTKGMFEGLHAVKIIGWGVENNVKYWIIANSWNSDWGEAGYFRMIRGTNDCGLEEDCSAGIPKL